MSVAHAPTPVATQQEHIFLDERNVIVSNSRFIVPGKTFAIAGVTSVSSQKLVPSRKGPITVIALGLIALFGGKDILVGAMIFIAVGIAWWVLHKPTYRIKLCSAAGEQSALDDKDPAFISRIVGAVNEAIVYRG